MLILGIETSCDETSVSVVSISNKSIEVLSNVVSSQIKLHAKWGGVVPHLASREHAKNIDHVLKLALKESKKRVKDIDLIAVTSGPGLIGSLMVGVLFAKTLAWKYNKPIVGVNHMEGHIYSNWLGPIREFKISNLKFKIDKTLFPSLCLIVSGGHTQLVLMTGHGKYKLLGQTLDDAAGEAFDKIARMLGLSYPGGPIISKYAEKGNPQAFVLPRPMLKHKNYNFSFSGLKTSVLYLVRDLDKNFQGSTLKIPRLSLRVKHDIAASVQAAIVEVLVAKTLRAAKEYKAKTIMLAGGVSANHLLRKTLIESAELLDTKPSTLVPSLEYTTDNAAMIAAAGYFNYLKNNPDASKKLKGRGSDQSVGEKYSWRSIQADANWEIF